jgi:hypothetical protein
MLTLGPQEDIGLVGNELGSEMNYNLFLKHRLTMELRCRFFVLRNLRLFRDPIFNAS